MMYQSLEFVLLHNWNYVLILVTLHFPVIKPTCITVLFDLRSLNVLDSSCK